MADIFISYSKKHAALTIDLARDLEAAGYTTWWDTSLLPDDVFFPQTIRAEIEAAKAVIVIWAEHSIASPWVYSEAQLGNAQGKLLQVRDEALDPNNVPLPFTAGNISVVSDRAKIFAALTRRNITQAFDAKPAVAEPAPPLRPSVIMGGESIKKPPAVRVMVGLGSDAREMWLKPGESFRDFDGAPEMVIVPPGKFWMGSKDGEGEANERPRHEVTIPQAFAVGKYPVTFAEWDAYVADGVAGGSGFIGFGKRHNPGDGGWGRGRRPVINVNWNDAQKYIRWINGKVSGQPYRLLSESEWEYACRAGTQTAYSFGDSEADLFSHAWFQSNSGSKTHPVGEKIANGFGLHDIHGNVWEWCEDWRNSNYEDKTANLKETGAAWTSGDGADRIVRGGCYSTDPGQMTASWRIGDTYTRRENYIGFRVAKPIAL